MIFVNLLPPKKMKMAWEWNWPRLWRDAEITWFHFGINVNRRGDHSPGVWVLLVVFDLVLIDCGYYNCHHDEYNR